MNLHLIKGGHLNISVFKRCWVSTLIRLKSNSSQTEIAIVKPVKHLKIYKDDGKQMVPFTFEKEKRVTVSFQDDISHISGIPFEHIEERFVRIYCTPKNAMQSGTDNVGHWELEFETRERWENPLMGWCSGGDPHSNVKVQFVDKESAIQFAEKNGYKWQIDYNKKNSPKTKSYALNFSWNKRTRVTTK